MSNQNYILIESFYTAFADADGEGMIKCYDSNALFNDPVFGTLRGDAIFTMWRMLIKRSNGNIDIKFGEITTDGDEASVDWVASYPYGPKARRVINFVHAEFVIRDGKIIEHRDDFDLWQWSRQALGFTGTILGWSGFIKNKIRQNAADMLAWYQDKGK